MVKLISSRLCIYKKHKSLEIISFFVLNIKILCKKVKNLKNKTLKSEIL
jgi:hypothetical protein